MSVHLHPVSTDPLPTTKVREVFLVIQRSNGEWSPGAKIMSAHSNERDAQDEARKLKELHPQQSFGVFVLLGEARVVSKPIEFVRVAQATPKAKGA